MISEEATTKLEEIINELIILFRDYTGQHGNQYAESYFDVSKVVAQLAEIMEVARPTMTQNPVI
jgi:ribosome biogenesis protein Nip4